MDNQNQIIMKDEIIIDGITYRKVEPEKELTLEDCMSENLFYTNMDGFFYELPPVMKGRRDFTSRPTQDISEKEMIFGLLHSVAFKLNGGDLRNRGYAIMPDMDKGIDDYIHGYFSINLVTGDSIYPLFRTEELADQAIRIFENSKFDLKKLFQ